jgi:hypothetical protein
VLVFRHLEFASVGFLPFGPLWPHSFDILRGVRADFISEDGTLKELGLKLSFIFYCVAGPQHISSA